MATNKQEHAEHASNFMFKTIHYLEFAATEGNGHTNFYLNLCQRCKKVVAFPESNFKLITSAAKEQIIQDLKAMGLELIPELLN